MNQCENENLLLSIVVSVLAKNSNICHAMHTNIVQKSVIQTWIVLVGNTSLHFFRIYNQCIPICIRIYATHFIRGTVELYIHPHGEKNTFR